MAWQVHYECQFRSRTNILYSVEIFEQNYVGNIVQLTGYAEPFVTQEDDNDDIFTPLRAQTGFLRVIDTDGTLMERLIPANNVEKLVKLVSATYSAGSWTYTTHWQGFLAASVYTQPYNGSVNVIEIPLISTLGALSYVYPDLAYENEYINYAKILLLALDSLSIRDSYQGITIIDDTTLTSNFLFCNIFFQTFFKKEETVNGDESVPVSFAEILSAICRLYGLTLRENGDNIYFEHFDKLTYHITKETYPMSEIVNISNRVTPTLPTSYSLSEANLMDTISFKGSNNQVSFQQGRKNATLTLNLLNSFFSFNFPQSPEDASTPVVIDIYDPGNLYVQPHNVANGEFSYLYHRYDIDWVTGSGDEGIYQEAGSYSDCVENSILYSPWLYPTSIDYRYNQRKTIYTGAFLCRWYLTHSESEQPGLLKSGLFLNLMPYSCTDGVDLLGYEDVGKPIFKYVSQTSYKFMPGTINVNIGYFWVKCVHEIVSSSYVYTLYLGEDTDPMELYYTIKIGNTYIENRTISEEMNGVFTLEIYSKGGFRENWSMDPLTPTGTHCRSVIIESLDVQYTPDTEITSSSAGENKYFRGISLFGFEKKENISLEVGTNNNNVPAVNLIRDNAMTLVETFTYLPGIPLPSTVEVRPESRLLDRMEAYWSQVRRSFRFIIQSGTDLFTSRYTYLSKKFFGIDAQHNWREETQEVKFIEVT